MSGLWLAVYISTGIIAFVLSALFIALRISESRVDELRRAIEREISVEAAERIQTDRWQKELRDFDDQLRLAMMRRP